MIRKLKKYLFVGLQQDRAVFFKNMQKRGLVEFLSQGTQQMIKGAGSTGNLIDAIKILRTMPYKEQLKSKSQLVNASTLADSIVSTQEMKDSLEEEIKFIDAEIHRIGPLGNFSLSQIKEIEKQSKRVIQFFCIKKDKLHQMESIGDYIYISSFFDLDFFMSIAKEKKSPEYMLEVRVQEDLKTLKNKKEQKIHLLKEKQHFLYESAEMISFLQDAAIDSFNNSAHDSAQKGAQDRLENLLFSVEGWMPEYKARQAIKEFEKQGIIIEEVPIKKDDRVPTHMTNKGLAHIGEDLVHIYDTPSPSDKDPSTFVFFAFIVFYAMIISDAGYGALYALLAFFLGWKFKNSKMGSVKRFVKLFKIIAVSTIVWGVLAGSYFGIDLHPSSPLSKISVLTTLARKKAEYHLEKQDETYKEWVKKIPALKKAKNGQEFLDMGIAEKDGKMEYQVFGDFKDGIFLEIALMVGILHISIALFYSLRQNFANIGWVLAMVGGYLYFPDMLNASSMVYFLNIITPQAALFVGRDLMIAGFSIAIILGVIQHRLKGLLGCIVKVIELFADVLSYLRLYALGLAGMILASTFNNMGLNLMESFGFVVGAVVIVLGHGINIIVGVMGGTIHGLRLNFIEWYHHCFEGGGKLFQPLRLLTKRR
ncbi:V-type ATP synthase subunit I [Candidatus Aerophobetes bacterium]|uniref:V-type ATP synthase subunit I n=1 Tax=Aerophobetes bacterium TaxID=2030807 RepID=A0A2A4X6H6_UNCAE|nr:MAG: V-type ATP synthase subunit I [Candidatus Aerophobetes bacterium]